MVKEALQSQPNGFQLLCYKFGMDGHEKLEAKEIARRLKISYNNERYLSIKCKQILKDYFQQQGMGYWDLIDMVF